jgi:hypothetical protein
VAFHDVTRMIYTMLLHARRPYQNVHWPLEAPQEFLDMFSEVPDNARQHVCAMAKILDEGVGNITAALKSKGIYDETIQIFSSDNGGPTNHNEGTFSDNFPMRGGKNTIWEVRSPSFRNSLAYINILVLPVACTAMPVALYCRAIPRCAVR